MKFSLILLFLAAFTAAELDKNYVEEFYKQILDSIKEAEDKYNEIPHRNEQLRFLNAHVIIRLSEHLKREFNQIRNKALYEACERNKCYGSEAFKKGIAKVCLHTDHYVDEQMNIFNNFVTCTDENLINVVAHIEWVEKNMAVLQNSKRSLEEEYKDKENLEEIILVLEYHSYLVDKAKADLLLSVEQLKRLYTFLRKALSECAASGYPQISQDFYYRSSVQKCLSNFLHLKRELPPSKENSKTDDGKNKESSEDTVKDENSKGEDVVKDDKGENEDVVKDTEGKDEGVGEDNKGESDGVVVDNKGQGEDTVKDNEDKDENKVKDNNDESKADENTKGEETDEKKTEEDVNEVRDKESSEDNENENKEKEKVGGVEDNVKQGELNDVDKGNKGDSKESVEGNKDQNNESASNNEEEVQQEGINEDNINESKESVKEENKDDEKDIISLPGDFDENTVTVIEYNDDSSTPKISSGPVVKLYDDSNWIPIDKENTPIKSELTYEDFNAIVNGHDDSDY